MSLFLSRIIRALRLDKQLFEEAEADPKSLLQAMTVVVLASVAGGIGMPGEEETPFILGALGALFAWAVWAFITYLVGTKLLPTAQTVSSPAELMRTLGFAYAPGLLNVLGVMPVLGWAVRGITAVWMLLAWVIAVRQALDYESTGRAVLVCLIGWVVVMGLNLLLMLTGLSG